MSTPPSHPQPHAFMHEQTYDMHMQLCIYVPSTYTPICALPHPYIYIYPDSSVQILPQVTKLVVYLIFGLCPFTSKSLTSVCLFACVSVVAFLLLLFCFVDVASFFVSLVFIEYVVCSVLIEHVQRFQPQAGCSQRDSAL